jgi:4-amino-4-deoxy-L-arabinose transferase-like glycosyltransferase
MVASAGQQSRPARSTRALSGLLDFARASHARANLVLLVVALLFFLPGFFSIPPVDRDEARFAQATKQMLETGDYIDIRFQDEVRYKKPVGIYWLQAASVKGARAIGARNALTTIWLYRIPSLLGAIGAVLLTYWCALAFVSRRAALFAALMMASSVLLGIERLLAKTDAMLLLTVVAATGALARTYLPQENVGRYGDWANAAVFWTALAVGVLLKGPLIVMIVALAAATLVIVDRSARWLWQIKPMIGVIWFAALVLPWFLAITGRAGEAFYSESLGQDLLTKIFSGQEGHGAPPGYYFVLFWITFWPGATLAALATPFVWTARHEPAIKFLLAWLVPAWFIFELVITKLPHYVLPLYPAIAILAAAALDRHMLSRKPLLVGGTMAWFVLPLLAGLTGCIGLAVIGHQFGFFAWVLVGAAAVTGLLAWRLYEMDGLEHSFLRAVTAGVLTGIANYSLVLPALGYFFPSPALARAMRDSGCAGGTAAAAGYEEPSLVFLAGTDTQLTDGAGAAEFLRGGPCRFAFVEARQEKSFVQRADAVGLRYSAGPRIDGFNVSSGKPIVISVYRSREPS